MLNSLSSSTDKKSNKLQISSNMECCVIVHVCYVSCARFLEFWRVHSNLICNISVKFFSQNAAMFLVTSLQPSRYHRSREYTFDELFEGVSLGGERERESLFIVFALFPVKHFPVKHVCPITSWGETAVFPNKHYNWWSFTLTLS